MAGFSYFFEVRKEIREFRQISKSAWTYLLIVKENGFFACIRKIDLFCAFTCLKLHFRLLGSSQFPVGTAKVCSWPRNGTVFKGGREWLSDSLTPCVSARTNLGHASFPAATSYCEMPCLTGGCVTSGAFSWTLFSPLGS